MSQEVGLGCGGLPLMLRYRVRAHEKGSNRLRVMGKIRRADADGLFHVSTSYKC